MPGDDWQKFANLRAYFGYMMGHPGKKLLFMGGEFGQWSEWYHKRELDWELLEENMHSALQKWVSDLNHLYAREKALHEMDENPGGFEWLDPDDSDNCVVSFLRRGKEKDEFYVVISNFTPVVRHAYRIGVPEAGLYREVLNSDSDLYGGSNVGNLGGVEAEPVSSHGKPHSLLLTLPPLATLFLKREGRRD
jgi:1,4-alpha-glucan branching enzyme